MSWTVIRSAVNVNILRLQTAEASSGAQEALVTRQTRDKCSCRDNTYCSHVCHLDTRHINSSGIFRFNRQNSIFIIKLSK